MMTEEWTGSVDRAEVHDHELTDEEIATLAQLVWRTPDGKIAYWPKDDPPLIHKPAEEKVWFGWMSHTGVWSNPDHTIKGFEHLGPVRPPGEG